MENFLKHLGNLRQERDRPIIFGSSFLVPADSFGSLRSQMILFRGILVTAD